MYLSVQSEKDSVRYRLIAEPPAGCEGRRSGNVDHDVVRWQAAGQDDFARVEFYAAGIIQDDFAAGGAIQGQKVIVPQIDGGQIGDINPRCEVDRSGPADRGVGQGGSQTCERA